MFRTPDIIPPPPPDEGNGAGEVEPLPPLPAAPAEPEEEEPLPPLPAAPAEPEEEEPLPPLPAAPAESEEEEPLPPPLSALPSPRKPGTGVAVVLGIAAFFAAALGFQSNGQVGKLRQEINGLQGQLEKEVAKEQDIIRGLDDIEQTEQQIQEAEARLKQLQEKWHTLRAEELELDRYSRPGFLARDKAKTQDSIAILQRQLLEINQALEVFLPPNEMPEDKLLQRDKHLRKLVPLYLSARRYVAPRILFAMHADSVTHRKTGSRAVSNGRVVQALMEEPGCSYELRAMGYNGVHVELILKELNTNRWHKEMWRVNEEGRIFRWDEEISTEKEPALSAGFRNVTLAETSTK